MTETVVSDDVVQLARDPRTLGLHRLLGHPVPLRAQLGGELA